MAQHQFILVAVNLLHRAFVTCTRAEAKQRYRKLGDGEQLLLGDVKLEDGSTARFAVSLDSSEHVGRLNFSGFRTSVEVLLANLAQALQEERELPVFGSDDTGATIFGATGVTATGATANVMVLAAGPGQSRETTVLQLLYLDPAQFKQASA
jgi:hypothetical protein